MAAYPSPDESFALLHAAGWSVGEVRVLIASGPLWQIDGANGENRIQATAATQAEAWSRAVEQARSLGMLARTTATHSGPLPRWAGPRPPICAPAPPPPAAPRDRAPLLSHGGALALILPAALAAVFILADPGGAGAPVGFGVLGLLTLVCLVLEVSRRSGK